MKRKTQSIFLLLVFLSVGSLQAQTGRLEYQGTFAPSEGYVSKIEKPLRKEICLNGRWDFQAVSLPSSYQQGKGIAPELPLPEENQWDKVKIKIPSPWNINAFANQDLEGPDHRNFPSYPKEWEDVKMAWMRKTVTIPAEWKDEKIVLHFEAVAGQTQVFVNGKKATENFDIFLPFEVDITSLVTLGETAEILVGVRSEKLFEDNSTKGRRIIPAGSMWGNFINGIWQDVYLLALPKININDIYIKPLVSSNTLALDITIENTTNKEEKIVLNGSVNKWINKAGTEVNTAPVPNWELAKSASLLVPEQKLPVKPGLTKITLQIPVKEGDLDYWTPEYPNLYGLILNLVIGNNAKIATTDRKYERFGWREWTFDGTKQLLNGKTYPLKGDSWHFMGVPQLTRRYAWAWFTALKDANANAVRPHAQVYPSFYLDLADEMGICVLDETANWASDGGPKMDSPLFWENSKGHLRRMILRDRNHAGIFGWSISNENRPVIMFVFNEPEWMKYQEQAWKDWREIVRENDSTRPWISADGEDDGEGILPTTVGHYGDETSLKHWASIGKPWGVGETSMAYYGTPEQVSKFNGERAYESMEGRMEGLAYECYKLISQQRKAGASYTSVFNIVWYGLQPLPFGKRDLKTPPTLEDGIHFGAYKEGQPGIQPERIGPYSSTFNPGYDPTLPLYRAWPMFDAIKAANSGDKPAWSKWSQQPENKSKETIEAEKTYNAVLFEGAEDSSVKKMFEKEGVEFVSEKSIAPSKQSQNILLIIDGSYIPGEQDIIRIKRYISQGSDIWLWSPAPATLSAYQPLLPAELILQPRAASSFIPIHKSWMENTVNSDFYFCEIQTNEACQYGMTGKFVTEGDVLLKACHTNWRKWNKRPEELKTAAVLRSENEQNGPDAVFVKYCDHCSTFYVSTLTDFTANEKGYHTLAKIMKSAGIQTDTKQLSESLMDAQGIVQLSNLLVSRTDGRKKYSLWVYSPRPLDDLLIEPDMPKLDIAVPAGHGEIQLNSKKLESYKEVPLKQGWNQLVISLPDNTDVSDIQFACINHPEFIKQLQTSLSH